VDTLIARRVAADQKKHPNSKYLIVYGTYHTMGSGHLRDQLAKVGLDPDLVIIDEADGAHWDATERTPQFEYLKFSNNVYYANLYSPLERYRQEWDFSRRKFDLGSLDEWFDEA